MTKKRLSFEGYYSGIINQDNIVLAQAITLLESHNPKDQKIAEKLINKILPYTGNSIRIGITGVPGVGKSTFIEALGLNLLKEGKKIAVLTIDPSSQKSKGSILGDKTRMPLLSNNSNSFIRPSASGNALGGVAQKTREAMLLCEAAGYDIILVETVGVGQSETEVKNMTDIFLLLMLANAGDELQGIKKGIMEMATHIAINKSDGSNIENAEVAKNIYSNALHILPLDESGIAPIVETISALENTGIGNIWTQINHYVDQTKANGFHLKNREQQNVLWFEQVFQEKLLEKIKNNNSNLDAFEALKSKVQKGSISPQYALKNLPDGFDSIFH